MVRPSRERQELRRIPRRASRRSRLDRVGRPGPAADDPRTATDPRTSPSRGRPDVGPRWQDLTRAADATSLRNIDVQTNRRRHEDHRRRPGADRRGRPEPEQLPRHVAIIMDGNGRWAQRRGLPRIMGHRQGIRSVRAVVEEGCRLGLEQLTLYCFSVENWKRPDRELRFLMRLLRHFLVVERAELMEQNVRLTDDRPPRGAARPTCWPSSTGRSR